MVLMRRVSAHVKEASVRLIMQFTKKIVFGFFISLMMASFTVAETCRIKPIHHTNNM